MSMFLYYNDYKNLSFEDLKLELARLKFETGRFEKINKRLQQKNKNSGITEHIGVSQETIQLIEEFIRRKTEK